MAMGPEENNNNKVREGGRHADGLMDRRSKNKKK